MGVLLMLIAALPAPAAPAVPAADPEWQELKGPHFIVRYQKDAAYAQAVLRRCEADYDWITRDLDFTRRGNFWIWDNRAHIEVFATRQAYLDATRAPTWSAGKADYVGRTIRTFEGSQEFLNAILPHEITHLIFREFIGFRGGIPLWLDEGVAQWEDSSNRERVAAITRSLAAQGTLRTIESLTAVKGVDLGPDAAIAFYAQSASVVGFMINQFGRRLFREFCGHLRDGRSVEDALRFTYPQTIRSLEALESAWRAHLGDQTP